ncbi:phosphotransferase [Thalassotalea euphylliae]
MDSLGQLKQLLRDDSLEVKENVQNLWSGYGQIVRIHSKKQQQQYVVKIVAPPANTSHPRGWNTATGHQRKLLSYQVESAFYQHYACHTDKKCRVPKLIARFTHDNKTLLVLEDLDESGFFVRQEAGNKENLTIALDWLANFHASFLHTNADQLWPIGTYWHLGTRKDEWQKMASSQFKTHAREIETALNNATFQTLVHGDAKFANLCFHHDAKSLAAVDFQYVGLGSPVKDIMYLVGSGLESEALYSLENFVLDTYLAKLKLAINHHDPRFSSWHALEEEIHMLYPVAWADFYRFLMGWNPDSWKVCPYMEEKAEEGLSYVKHKQ